jgi:cytochrome c-type biogenesis protein CcmH/NrfG
MKNQSPAKSGWTNVQIYTAIVVVLIVGLLGGYLLHNNSQPAAAPAPAAPAGQPANGADMALNAEIKQLQDKVSANPTDVASLTELGNIYFDNSQWTKAIEYYTRSLEQAPKNADVRTDMGIAYFYSGDADRALREFDVALKDDPRHVQTLYNVGVVKKDGKHDLKGAIAAWEQVLKIDPQYRDRAKLESMLSEAKAQVK